MTQKQIITDWGAWVWLLRTFECIFLWIRPTICQTFDLFWSQWLQEKKNKPLQNVVHNIEFLQRLKLPTSPWTVSSTRSQALTHCLAAPGARLQSGSVAELEPTAMLWHCVCPSTLIFRVMFCFSWRSKSENYSLCVRSARLNQSEPTRQKRWFKFLLVRFLLFIRSEFSTPCCPWTKWSSSFYLVFFPVQSPVCLISLKRSTTPPQSTFACKV